MNSFDSPSRPMSPSIPRWLMPRNRSNASARHIWKLALLAFICVAVGFMVSQIYTIDMAVNDQQIETQLKLKPTDASELDQWTDDIDLMGLGDGHAEGKHNATKAKTPGSGHANKAGSLYDKIAGKVSSLHHWWGSASHKTIDSSNKSSSVGATSPYTGEQVSTPYRYNILFGARPTVGKISILFGDSNPSYERALQSHTIHNKLNNYPMFTLRQSILDDVWTKPAYILSVMLREMAKPESERLKWLLWVDGDTILLNPRVPIEAFLPPQDFDKVNLLVSHDWNGLNNGVFPIRVCAWSVELLSGILSYRFYRPENELPLRDQSAMADLLQDDKFKSQTIQVPQRWFNAYQGEVNETIGPHQVRRGDLLVHFAGVGERESRMEYWLHRVEEHGEEWELDFKHTSYKTEISDFWHEKRQQRAEMQRSLKAVKEEATRLRDDLLHHVEPEIMDKLDPEAERQMHHGIEAVNKAIETDNIEQIRERIKSLIDDSEAVRELVAERTQEVKKKAELVLFEAEKDAMNNHEEEEAQNEVNRVVEATYLLKGHLMKDSPELSELEGSLKEVRKAHEDLKRRLKNLRDERQDAAKAAEQAAKDPSETAETDKNKNDGREGKE